jgi:radical SAM protein with 4Fe4S-binding SPASM domain
VTQADDPGYAVKRSPSQHRLFGGRQPLLGHLDIELTERCNNACIHCCINLPQQDDKAARRELSTEQWKDILRQAADLGALSVRLTGGEPLLRPDFTEIYLFARRLGMRVVLFTNARLITSELADLLATVPPLKKVEVSIYGMHPQSYDAVACAPGAFAEFRRGLDLLLERRVPFMVKSVLLPPNRGEIEEFEAWTATIPGMDRLPAYAVFLDLRARRDLPTKNRLIAGLRFSPEEAVWLAARHGDAYRSGMAQFGARFLRPQGDRLFACGAGETGCVDAYGVYQMCLMLRHPDVVYDLGQGTIRQALTAVFPRFRELRATNPAYLHRCARCFLKGLCKQCPAKSWAEHGTLDTPVEYLCQVAHAQARYLGLLTDGEQAWEVAGWQQRIEDVVQRTRQSGESMSEDPILATCRGDS